MKHEPCLMLPGVDEDVQEGLEAFKCHPWGCSMLLGREGGRVMHGPSSERADLLIQSPSFVAAHLGAAVEPE